MDARAWDQRYSKEDLEWGAEPNRFLVDQIADMAPGRALDLGAGEGRNAVWLAERGWEVVAVDFSSVGIRKGERLAADRRVKVEWVVEDLLDFEPSAGTFDLAILFYIHLPGHERRAILAKGSSALRAGGIFLIVGHDRTNLSEGVGGPQDPALLFDAQEIASELGDVDIEVAERIRRAVPGEDRDAIDTLVRARVR